MPEAALGGAPAPAETNIAAQQVPIEQGSQVPNPAEKTLPSAEPKPEPKAEKPSIDQAIKNAAQKVEARREAEKPTATEEPTPKAKTEAKAEPAKSTPERGEDGKFLSKTPASPEKPGEGKAAPGDSANVLSEGRLPHSDPPARFLAAAKEKWAEVPDIVKEEIHRQAKNYDQGIERYRAELEPLKQFADEAKKNGTDLPTALKKYTGIENLLRQDLRAGMEQIVQNLDLRKQDGSRVTFYDLATAVLGQTPEQRTSQQEATVAGLRNEIADLKQQLSGVVQTVQTQAISATERQVNEFAQDHPRFEELSNDITLLLESKRASSLEEAYELAERMNPAPTNSVQVDSGQTPEASAKRQSVEVKPLNPAGQKSIAGAPASGSDPAKQRKKGPAPSIDEAIARAKSSMRMAS